MKGYQFLILLSILVLLMTVFDSSGYPDGAPPRHKVCKHLVPHHIDMKPQKTPSPFSIIPERVNITCGSTLNVNISARPGFAYKGFIMQARGILNRAKPIGTFQVADKLLSKTIDCFETANNTVTHSSAVLKKSLKFEWTPPAKFKGSVDFVASVVQNFSTFWTHVFATIVVRDSDESDGKGVSASLPMPVSFPLYDDIAHAEVSDLNQTIYEECGVTKTCFGIPEDCVLLRSCDALVTVVARESKYEFEMVGMNYVAVSLSEDGYLDVASATECVLVDNAVVKLYQSRSLKSAPGYRDMLSYDGLELINSSYWDGMVYCKYVREEVIELNGVQYNFRDKKYSILLASENKDTRKSDENVTLDNVKFHSSEQNYLSNATGFSTPVQTKYTLNKFSGWILLILDFILGVMHPIFSFFWT